MLFRSQVSRAEGREKQEEECGEEGRGEEEGSSLTGRQAERKADRQTDNLSQHYNDGLTVVLM